MPDIQRSPNCPCCGHSFGSKDVSYTGPHGGRLPLLLLCGHSVCEGCLTKLTQKSVPHVACPVCQDKMSLGPDMIKSLPVDTYAVGLVTLRKKSTVERIKTSTVQFSLDGTNSGSARKKDKDSQRQMCIECSTRAATCCCHKCEAVMCGTCFEKVHKMSKIFRKHQASPLVESDTETLFPAYCSKHDNRPVEYYCEDDQTPICSHCFIMDHKGHAISAMEDKNKKALSQLEPALDQTKLVLKRMKQSDKMMSTASPNTPGLQHIIDEISLHFRKAHGLLQAREAALLDELHTKYEVECSVEEMRTKLQRDIWDIDQAIKEADHCLAARDHMNSQAQAILGKLTRFKTLPCVAIKISERDHLDSLKVRFKDEVMSGTVRNFGELSGEMHVGFTLRSLEEVPTELVPGPDTPSKEPTSSIFDPPSAAASVSDTHSVVSEPLTPTDTDDTLSQSSEAPSVCSTRSGGTETPKHGKLKMPKYNRVRIRPLKTEMVYVTHIKNPGQFMIQRCTDFERLKVLQRKILKYCSSPNNNREVPHELDVGDYVLSVFKNTWYRARVTEVLPPSEAGEEIQVALYYVDYGNTDTVYISQLRTIKQMFMKVPELVKTCALKDIKPTTTTGEWTHESIHAFARMTADKPMEMKVLVEDDVYHVDLCKPGLDSIADDPSVSIRDMLVFIGHAEYTAKACIPTGGSTNALIPKPPKSFFRPTLPTKASEAFGCVSYVETPDKFFFQQGTEEAKYLHKMMTEMQVTYNHDNDDLYTVFVPVKGMVCVCKFLDDKAWYRAQVLDLLEDQQVLVRYVDYGNEEVVSHWQLRKVLDSFTILPMQALQCTLADVKPKNDKAGYPEDVKKNFSIITSFQQVIIEVKDVDEAGVLHVVLTEVPEEKDRGTREPKVYNRWLVEKGHAVSTGPSSDPSAFWTSKTRRWLYTSSDVKDEATEAKSSHRELEREIPLPQLSPPLTPAVTSVTPRRPLTPEDASEKPPYQEVKVSHIVNAGEMYMHLASSEDERTRLMVDMNTALAIYHEVPMPLRWTVGQSCGVRSETDGKWYRGKVLELQEDGAKAKMLMLDYGFQEVAALDQLCILPDDFRNQTQFTFRCHLEGLQPAGDITRWSRTSTEYLTEALKDRICYIVTKGELEDGSAAVDLLREETIQGDALTGNQTSYVSVGRMLREKGLALPKRARNAAIRKDPAEPKLAVRRDTEAKPPGSQDGSSASSSRTVTPPPGQASGAADAHDEGAASAPPESPRTPPPVSRPTEALAPPPASTLMDYRPPEMPTEAVMAVVPTYVDYDCQIFVQEVKPDHHPEGRLGCFLREHTLEVKVQDAYFRKMALHRAKIVRDGNCLFRACAQALYGDQDRHREVRDEVIRAFHDNWWMYEHLMDKCTKEEYIAKIAKDGSYGGEMEIQAIASTRQIQVQVYMGGVVAPIVIQHYGDPARPSIALSYVADGHYDNGHYDLVVGCPGEAARIEAGYNVWRERKIQDFTRSDRSFDNNLYEQSLLDQVMKYLDRRFSTSAPDPEATYHSGQAVVAKYSDDQRFYRARVLDVTDQGYKVLYVDFGNFQILPASMLRAEVALPDIPIQCYRCMLDGVTPKTEKWDERLLVKIHEDLVGNTYNIKINDVLDGPLLLIDFDTESRGSYCQKLCDENDLELKVRHPTTTKTKLPQQTSGQMRPQQHSPTTDPVTYYGEQLPPMMQQPSMVYPGTSVPMPNSVLMPPQGPLIVAHTSPHISPNQSPPMAVQHIPGISHHSPPMLGSHHSPPLAVISTGPPGIAGFPPGMVQGPFPSAHPMPSQDSTLEDIPTSVDEVLAEVIVDPAVSYVDLCELYGLPQRAVPSPYPQPSLPSQGDVLHVTVTQIDYPNTVYLQHEKQIAADAQSLTAINAQLDQLMEITAVLEAQHDQLPPVRDPKPGLPCVAQYSQDMCWYRAEVVSVGVGEDDYNGVLFVDYGSSEYLPTDRLRRLPEEMLYLPAQAFKCVLSGVEPPRAGDLDSWDPRVTLRMTELLAPHQMTAIVKSCDLELEVDLYRNEDFHIHGLDAPLAYNDLIRDGTLGYSQAIEGHNQDEYYEEGGAIRASLSWGDQAELDDRSVPTQA